MPKKRPLLKKDIEVAYAHAKSARSAATYLNVAYNTFKKYAIMYGMFKINRGGVGIPRPKMRGSAGIQEIFEGKHPRYPNKKLRERIIRLGILPLKCNLCGYDQKRLDGRPPLTLYFKDGDSTNKRLENIELRCYNCMYLTTGKMDPDVLNMNPQTFEQDMSAFNGAENVNWVDLQKEVQNEIEKEREKEEDAEGGAV